MSFQLERQPKATQGNPWQPKADEGNGNGDDDGNVDGDGDASTSFNKFNHYYYYYGTPTKNPPASIFSYKASRRNGGQRHMGRIRLI